jgi:hypothetical protein
MKINIKLNIEKKYAFIIISLLVVIAGVVMGYAYNSSPANPAVMGHSTNEISGIVMDSGEVSGSSEASLTKTITLNSPGLLFMSGGAKSNYHSITITANAGDYVTLFIDGIVCNNDMSFEAISSSIDFYSSTSCIKKLNAGVHVLKLEHSVTAAKRISSSLQYAVISAN